MTDFNNDGINKVIQSMPGWFTDVDIVTFDFIFKTIQEFNFPGHCVEIGTYKGKSLSKISQYVNTSIGEKILSVDLEYASTPDRMDSVRRNIITAVPKFNQYNIKFISGESNKLLYNPEIAEFFKTTKFIHVDGSHTGIDVYSDLEFAEAIGNTNTILVLDDWTNPAYPHLQEAYYKYHAIHPNSYIPFFISDAKCYLCRPVKHHDWMWKFSCNFTNFLQSTPDRKKLLYNWYIVKTENYLTYDTYMLLKGNSAIAYNDRAYSVISDPQNIIK